ncbi:MAG: hypothetical protein QOC65_716 [Sphingomonadales bacterium]|nr:hypothetical protein [Sphingomonadales bacterium]
MEDKIGYTGAVTADSLWLLIGTGGALAAAAWSVRRFDVREMSAIRGEPKAAEPCWTEEIASDGRYSYSRGQCFNAELMDLEARARLGEFDTSA